MQFWCRPHVPGTHQRPKDVCAGDDTHTLALVVHHGQAVDLVLQAKGHHAGPVSSSTPQRDEHPARVPLTSIMLCAAADALSVAFIAMG